MGLSRFKKVKAAGILLAIVAALLLAGCYENPLIEAAKEGNVSKVKDLLSSGSDVNDVDKEGWTPLIAASWSGRLDVVRLLIEKGADVNARDNGGGTALSRRQRTYKNR